MYHRLVGWLIKKIIDRWCQNQHEKDDDAQQLSVDCRKYDIFVEEKRRKKRQSKIEIRRKLDLLYLLQKEY